MFAIRGLLRGVVTQAFAVLGLAAALVTASWMVHWVQPMWSDAQPAVAFTVLRWILVGTTALGVAFLFHWWGELVRGAVKTTGVGWLDHLGGSAVGAAVGTLVVTFGLLGALLSPWPRALSETAAGARMARPIMAEAARACGFGSRVLPKGQWLKQRFLEAERRAARNARTS